MKCWCTAGEREEGPGEELQTITFPEATSEYTLCTPVTRKLAPLDHLQWETKRPSGTRETMSKSVPEEQTAPGMPCGRAATALSWPEVRGGEETCSQDHGTE